MSRKATFVVSLLVVAGFVAALVRAQDYGPRYRNSTYQEPGRLPTAPPAMKLGPSGQRTPGGSLSETLRTATSDATAEYSGDEGGVAQTGGIKSMQFRTTRPNPTYPSGTPTAATRPSTQYAAPSAPPSGNSYVPVPTAPPSVAPAAPGYLPSGAAARPAQAPAPEARSQATLGAPVETEIGEDSEDVINVIPSRGDVGVAPAGGMRSVLKRPGGTRVSEALPPVTQPSAVTPDADPSPSDAGAPAVEEQSGPTGISARRNPTFSPATPAIVPSAEATASEEPATPATNRRTTPSVASLPRSIQDLELSTKAPSLRVDVAGPQGITIGKDATYVVNLFNDSDSEASDVQLKASLPSWVTIQSGETTAGEAASQSDGRGYSKLLWTVPSVPAKSHQTLRLVLIPSQGQPFDIGLELVTKPTVAKATIAVKQPQLEATLAGPAEMNFGQQKVFTLTVSNPGSGDADRVVVSIASGESRPQQIDVGSIPAGMQKEIPVQVVANHAGEMSMKVVASAEGGLRAEAVGKILVRQAQVAVDVQGPQLKYAGTDGSYSIVVANAGDASADDVTVTLALPTGAKYLGGIDGATQSPSGLRWKIVSLAAGAERQYEVKLQLNGMGMNRLVVQAHNETGIAATGSVETKVEAVSDLKLTVNDPAGPIAVGSDVVYEMTVVNRGTKSAPGVRVVMQFGEGIEPTSVEGGEAKLVPGQVIYQPLPQLASGEKATFKVKAAADRQGTHPFRVEVTTSDNETRLVTEGTTRFFAEDATNAAARTARQPSLLPKQNVPAPLQR